MLGVIVTRGKNVDDAVRKAAKQLEVKVEQVDYEVVDPGQSSFLFNRPTVIQAKVRDLKESRRKTTDEGLSPIHSQASVQVDSEEKHKELAAQKDAAVIGAETSPLELAEGIAWVKNGKVFCKDGDYQYALVSPCNGVRLTINGHAVTESSIVTEDDVVEVQMEEEMVESEFTLTISKDHMQVLLNVTPGYYVIWELEDLPPSRQLTLSVTETKIIKTDLKEFQVLEELKRLGVRFGIEYDEIQAACEAKEPVTIIVANGVEPIPGIDGGFELLQTKRKEQKDQFVLSEKTDWKERFSLPMVYAGEVIGRPIPAKAGIPGKNIFGEVVAAPAVKDVIIITAEGTTLHGADQKVVATASGRIKIDNRSNNSLCFSILPQLVHNGNVDLQSGNIRFHGDVYVIGHVEDGMSVEAGGSLHITGQVSNATVRTGGDAVINGSIVGSTVICGFSNLIWDKMLPSFKAIRDELIILIGAARQLESNRSFSNSDLSKSGLQPLLRLLTTNKLKNLPVRIREISTIIKNDKDRFDIDTIQIMDFLEKAFLYYHPLVTNLDQLDSLVTFMNNVISSVEYDANKKMNIQAKSLTSSSIMSAWNVKIDRFSYNSDIYCKGGVDVKETIRGGSIESGDYVEAKEVGSSGGGKTKVTVENADGHIKAELVWTDTLLKVGGILTKLTSQEEQVNVTLNKYDQLILR